MNRAAQGKPDKEETKLDMPTSTLGAIKCLKELSMLSTTRIEPKVLRKNVPEYLQKIALSAEIPINVAKALLAITYVIKERDTDIDATATLIADNILLTVNTRLGEHANVLEKSLDFIKAISKDQAETTCVLKNSTEAIKAASESLTESANRIDEKSKATPSPSSFADAVRRGIEAATSTRGSTPLTRHQPARAVSDPNMAIRNRLAIAQRQILLEFSNNDPKAPINTKLDLSELRTAVDQWLTEAANQNKITLPNPSQATKGYLTRIKLMEGGSLLLEFSDLDTTDAFRKLEAEGLLKDKICESTRITKRTYNVLAKFVPCKGKFDPGNKEHLRELEKLAELSPKTISYARWCKNPANREPNQKYAHVKFSCPSPEAANNLIRSRCMVEGQTLTLIKDSKEPLRCNKCHQYGHIQVKCPNPERCVKCGSSDHKGSECQKPPRCLACADIPGRSAAHANDARERVCETFREKAEDLSSRTPESQLPYFPILGNNETWDSEFRPPARAMATRFGNPYSTPEASQANSTGLGNGANSTPLGLWRMSQPEPSPYD